MAQRGNDQDRPTIARALDYLLRGYRDGEGNLVTEEQVATAIQVEGLSAEYITALREGTKRNPTADTLRALAAFFGVKAGFFFDPIPDQTSSAAADHEQAADSAHGGPDPSNVSDGVVYAVDSQANLAARLEYLFNLRVRPDGQPWSMRQVSAAAKEHGVALSVGYLHDLRRGIKKSPNMQQIECLAKIFGVWPGYFFQDDKTLEEMNRRLRTLDALENDRVASIAMRARNLSQRELNMVNALIDSALRDAEDFGKDEPRDR
ncbi:hypothetical protein Krad_4607 (plasmid) [Kineococcus radiotolerans SRS30216 = ATCC BAA-149]|uniref:HTH cro/C1-type domain-containing protein n=1 Tax=Kineococcus radiotolerans (strain ATCC BAA-149 / DSM 14245 / SRS30216) TaxID=266940 RepID=A6WGX7_KINRD|nr:hypothetical protein Krad_4607 [Kineococcus radiotolerans SRS30216 = ATCC BAA-149]